MANLHTACRTVFRTVFRTVLSVALCGVLTAALLTTGAPSQAAISYKPWGKAFSADKTLRSGCHVYRFNYRVNPPTGEWAAEIFLVNPNKRKLHHWAIDAAADPATGKLKATLCRWSTVYGRHKLKMKITYQVRRDVYDGWVRPTTFRFNRP